MKKAQKADSFDEDEDEDDGVQVVVEARCWIYCFVCLYVRVWHLGNL
jgi:hypothetical protein